jgi:hypothetical protein
MPSPTPPWQVDAWDLAADLSKIEQQWPAVIEILTDPLRADTRHAPTSDWSCGQQAGHAALAAWGIARGIQRALAEPDRDRDQTAHPTAAALLSSGLFPRGVAKASERIDPTGKSLAEMLAIAEPGATAWAGLSKRAEALAGCPARFPHFLLGHLTSAEWVRFCAIHTAHHLGIAREIEQAASSTHI